jgi:hypothetical protein
MNQVQPVAEKAVVVGQPVAEQAVVVGQPAIVTGQQAQVSTYFVPVLYLTLSWIQNRRHNRSSLANLVPVNVIALPNAIAAGWPRAAPASPTLGS